MNKLSGRQVQQQQSGFLTPKSLDVGTPARGVAPFFRMVRAVIAPTDDAPSNLRVHTSGAFSGIT